MRFDEAPTVYRQLFEEANVSHHLKHLRWNSDGKEDYERLVANWESSDTRYLSKTLPDINYFKENVLKKIIELTPDRKERLRLVKLVLSATKVISDAPVKDGGSKVAVAARFYNQFVSFLCQEDPRAILAIAKIQGLQANAHNDGGSTPLSDWEIKNFLIGFRDSDFKEYALDILELAASTDNPFNARRMIGNALDILQEFQAQQCDELIPAYISFSKATKYHAYDFDFKEKKIVDKLKFLSEIKNNRKLLFHLIELQLGQESSRDWDSIYLNIMHLQATNKLESEFAFKKAISLQEQGVDGFSFVTHYDEICEHTREKYCHYEEKLFVLAGISNKCAKRFIEKGSKAYLENHETRDRYIDAGIRLARTFGDSVNDYFECGLWVLKHHPKLFNRWLSLIDTIASQDKDAVKGFIETSKHALKNHTFDIMTDLILILSKERMVFDEEIAAQNIKKLDEYRHQYLYSTFFYAFREMYLFEEDRFQRFDGDFHLFTQDLLSFFKRGKISEFYNIYSALNAGIYYDKFIEFAEDIGRLDVKLSKVGDYINSEGSYQKKIPDFYLYGLCTAALKELPILDAQGEWKGVVRKELSSKVKEKFNIKGNLDKLSFNSLLKLASMTIYEGSPEFKKIQLIINSELESSHVAKSFPCGELLGSRTVGGVINKRDGVEITQQFVTAMISKDEVEIQNAALNFDETKLEEAKKIVSKKEFFNLIVKDLPELAAGDQAVARHILSLIKNQYKNVESINDIVTSIESLFEGDIRIDALVARTQLGRVEDLFDNRNFLCCTFYPGGIHAEESLNYLLDPEVCLVHLVPKVGELIQEPIGVAISVIGYNNNGEKFLHVCAVEAGAEIDRIKDSTWLSLMHESIVELGTKIDADYVAYNAHSPYTKPRKFLDFVRKKFKPEERELELVKNRTDTSTSNPVYLESSTFPQENCRLGGNINLIFPLKRAE